MSTENKAETKQTNFKALEEDDEFEDFPVQDWPNDKTITAEKQEHLWDESWNDDDNEDDFTKRLRQELANAEAKK
ncbi:26S proteasome complex subunit [Komagataella phaffii CBS 7435]|uniref:26S proteasome complex subunit SEM1 n=1 Tax=Komagataella phaffii (strain ATCC 76273 / CBS 7435 / CECT 11047 / NRRL Y-11430 / Wegner 21-1) TaxID=981350 RepID=F2QZM8_KOMPC|nr:26S proteasome complex subunit [Komagataella phaffii CBS 7435]CCA40856.1 26S proteasome complex subunit [Komagataella phaffii CBS 7435]